MTRQHIGLSLTHMHAHTFPPPLFFCLSLLGKLVCLHKASHEYKTMVDKNSLFPLTKDYPHNYDITEENEIRFRFLSFMFQCNLNFKLYSVENESHGLNLPWQLFFSFEREKPIHTMITQTQILGNAQSRTQNQNFFLWLLSQGVLQLDQASVHAMAT